MSQKTEFIIFNIVFFPFLSISDNWKELNVYFLVLDRKKKHKQKLMEKKCAVIKNFLKVVILIKCKAFFCVINNK